MDSKTINRKMKEKYISIAEINKIIDMIHTECKNMPSVSAITHKIKLELEQSSKTMEVEKMTDEDEKKEAAPEETPAPEETKEEAKDEASTDAASGD